MSIIIYIILYIGFLKQQTSTPRNNIIILIEKYVIKKKKKKPINNIFPYIIFD